VAVEVVPGITSAIAVPAAAGIPVTHRGLSRGFSVITAHADLGVLPQRRDHTLILLMGVSRLRDSVASLLEAGSDPATPAAIIERGYHPDQRVTTTELRCLAAGAPEAGARRRAAALGCLLLAGSLTLTGCSSKDSTPDAKAPASRAGSTGRPTSAPSASATASGTAGTVTAASLSDAQLGDTAPPLPAGAPLDCVTRAAATHALPVVAITHRSSLSHFEKAEWGLHGVFETEGSVTLEDAGCRVARTWLR